MSAAFVGLSAVARLITQRRLRRYEIIMFGKINQNVRAAAEHKRKGETRHVTQFSRTDANHIVQTANDGRERERYLEAKC